MPSLNDTFQSHPLCRLQRTVRKQEILDAFSGYVDETTFSEWHLALYKFATIRPLKYVRHQTIQNARTFFNQHPDLTIQALSQLQQQLSHAVFSLLRPGSSWNNEERLALDDPKHIIEFETIWHPEYQRYCEHVFNHLIRIPLFILGALRGRDYQQPALATRVDVLRNNGLTDFIEGYNSIVRNAISHGSVAFQAYEILYVDHNQQIELDASEFSKLFDNLVDTCHSLLVALLFFIFDNQDAVRLAGLDNLPLGLRFIFIDSFASHAGLELLSMVESTAANNRKQLNIACRIKSKARLTQLFEGLSACWQASTFGGKDYARYSIAFDCGTSVSPHLFVNGQRLLQAIDTNETVEECQSGLVESALLWQDVSGIRRKIYNWRSIVPPLWTRTKRQLVTDWRKSGLKVLSASYTIRNVRNQSAGSIRRLEAHVILHERGTISDARIQDIVKHIVRKLRNYRIQGSDIQGKTGLKLRPRYVWVRLYAEDRRIRTLLSSGWSDGNLVLRAEWFSGWRNNGAIFVRNPNAVVNRIRIEYNPQLIHQPNQPTS